VWPFASAFVAGVCAVLLLPSLPPLHTVGVCAAAGAALAVLLRSPVLLALTLGGLYCWHQAGARLGERLDPALEGRTLTIRGTVASVPQGSPELLRFRFAPDEPARSSPLLELTWYDAPWRPRAAELLEVEVRLRRPRGFANPGGSDNDARMLRDGIGASGYVRDVQRLGRKPAQVLRNPVLVARGAVAEAIRTVLGDRPAAGIVAGLSVGLQDALSRSQWLALSRSGTSHLMAISGLHIAMVGAIAAWAGGGIQRWRQRRGALGCRRDAAVLCGAIAALIYSVLAGWSVPTQRTMVMIALGAAALRWRRNVSVADGLAACAFVVVLMDPLAPLAPGFWLSFGAVAAILYASGGYLQRPRMLHGYLRVQAAVTLGLIPVLIGSFGSVSLVSAVVNLVAIPLYTLVIVPAVLAATACVLLMPGAGAVLMRGVASLIEATWPLIAVPASWPLATFAVAGLSPLAWGALLLGTVAVLSPLPRQGRIAGVILVCAACAWRPWPLDPGTFRLTALDVGQGLATIVATRSHVLVFDTGPSFRSGTDAGLLVLVPYLRDQGIRRIDVLAVSHDDDDHKGGTASVLGALPVRNLVLGPSIRRIIVAGEPAGRAQSCRRGVRWQWDGVSFEWLHPGVTVHDRDNDSSCVLLVRSGEHTVLLTGDIGAAAEEELLQSGGPGHVEVVVAPHHGSRTSSSAPFVAATAPRWVVFTAGHRNRWGFPAPAVVARWRSAGAHTLVTSTSGAIDFVATPGEALAPPRQWRIDRRRFWADP
jgi:competence protein ComEC